MKRTLIGLMLVLLTTATAVPSFGGTFANKQEAADFLVDLFKDKVKSAVEDNAKDALYKAAPQFKLMEKYAGIIQKAELAASVAWDLIDLGLKNQEGEFAKAFADKFTQYIPEVMLAAELNTKVLNPVLESVVGYRLPNEADVKTALYLLGKNTFKAITSMSGTDKQRAVEAGADIGKINSFMMGIGGSARITWKHNVESGNLRHGR